MPVNQDCVRDLLLFADQALTVGASGKRPRPVKLRHSLSLAPLDHYPSDEVYAAAQYLVARSFVTISALDPKNIPSIAPHAYVFLSVTPKGQDYLSAVRDGTLWKKLCHRFGRVFDATLPELISAAAEFGVKLLLG